MTPVGLPIEIASYAQRTGGDPERYVAACVCQRGGDGQLVTDGHHVIGVVNQAQIELEIDGVRLGAIVVQDANAVKCPAGSVDMRKDALEAVQDRYRVVFAVRVRMQGDGEGAPPLPVLRIYGDAGECEGIRIHRHARRIAAS